MRSDDIEAAARDLVERINVGAGHRLDRQDKAALDALRAALARPRESPGGDIAECRLSTTDAEAMRHAAAEIARAGAVAAYEAMAAAPRDGAQQYTRADVNEAIGLVLDGCEAQIRAIQIDAAKGGARG